MHVDRAKFLLLTSTLFASCKESEPAAQAPIVIPQQPASTASLAKEEPPPPPVVDASAPEQPVAADDDEEPYEPWPGTAEVPMAKTVKGQTCDAGENAKGAPVCTLRPPGPTCESFSQTRGECSRLRTWLVPRVAERAAKCLSAKSGKQDICYFNIGAACVIQAMNDVCLDTSPRIDTSCKRVMTKCGAIERQYRHINLNACKAAMSSIVPSRQAKFLTCMQESCDLVACHYATSS
ncbi:MAG TPA: hypothetical protein VIF62_22500 [Labilithrix sp.]